MDKDRDYKFAAGLMFSSSAFVITAEAFIIALFLAVYTNEKLPNLYLTQAIFVPVVIISMAAFLRRERKHISSALFIASLGLFSLVFVFLFKFFVHKYLPFEYCLFLVFAILLVDIISDHTISASYDVRKYKIKGKKVHIWSSFGAVCAGLAVALSIKQFGIDSVHYYLIILPFFVAYFVYMLKPLPDPEVFKHNRVNPFTYPLFVTLLIYLVLSVFACFFGEYMLRVSLDVNFSEAKIGEFMTLFFATTGLVGIVVQIVGTELIIDLLGVQALLIILPASIIIAGAIIFAKPTLAAFAVLFACIVVFNKTYTSFGETVFFNILPTGARSLGTMLAKTISYMIGVGLGAIIILFNKNIFPVYYISSIVIFLGIALIWQALRAKNKYQQVLEKIIDSKRFMSDFLDKQFMQNSLALRAIARDDDETKLFGLSLLVNKKYKKIPRIIMRCLDNDNLYIKKYVLQIINQSSDRSVIRTLKKKFYSAKSHETKAELLAAIGNKSIVTATRMTTSALRSKNIQLICASLLILFRHQGKNIHHAYLILGRLLKSPKKKVKLSVVGLLTKCEVENGEEIIEKFIVDHNSEVRLAAIEAWVYRHQNLNMLPKVIAELDCKKNAAAVANILMRCGNIVIPFVDSIIKGAADKKIRHIVSILLAINSKQSLTKLLTLYKQSEILLRTYIVRSIVYYSMHNNLEISLKKFGRDQVYFQVNEILCMIELIKKHKSKYIINEINSRIELSKQCYLYWLAISGNTKKILALFPRIVNIDNAKVLTEQALTFELLDTYVYNPKLAATITFIENSTSVAAKKANFDTFKDSWLETVIAYKPKKRGKNMDQLQKVFVLRNNLIFSHLSGEQLLAVANKCELIDVAKNEVIFNLGDAGNGLYIVVAGEIKVIREKDVLATLKSPDGFGELSLIDGEKRTASAIANTDSLLLFLEKDIFTSIISDEPDVLLAVTRTVVKYLRKDLKKLNI